MCSNAAGEAPEWMNDIHDSHCKIVCGGGFACCAHCGAVAASHRLKSGHFAPCSPSSKASWRLPEGSKWRLQRIIGGKHPEGSAAKSWPDGRDASMQIMMRTRRQQESEDETPLQPAAVEPCQWFDELEQEGIVAMERRERIVDVISILTAKFDATVSGTTISFAGIASFAEE